MALVLGRTWVLEEGYDFEWGKAYAPERSARSWGKRRRLVVSVSHDKLNGMLFVTFNAHRKAPKFAEFAAMAAQAPGAEFPCKEHERDRAARHARAAGLRAEFRGNFVQFVRP